MSTGLGGSICGATFPNATLLAVKGEDDVDAALKPLRERDGGLGLRRSPRVEACRDHSDVVHGTRV
ncbi:hypothetical protein FA13DRAFT_1733286 [Coprinellus micaceus]|uniref:Uncharacterized protein n=1 Tax=Coprinellus micaceus TaxID=71717 RepID=A0A4Y7TAA8_COPMI|nr:hypothetical protein FA13DRAFT_1733286 [Coprinellus micaceus]